MNHNELNEIDSIHKLKQLIERKSYPQTIYHYTTYESLLSILENRCIRLTRSDLLNDRAEEKLSGCSANQTRYVMSFTYTEKESVSMWAMYGKASGIKLRIGLQIRWSRRHDSALGSREPVHQ